jgi:hypothetical protein
MATKAKKASARKKAGRSKSRPAKRSAGTSRKTTMRASARKSTSSRSATANGRKSPVARVKAVATEVAQQATVAVAAGVETLKDLGGQLVDRVRA